MIKYAPQYLRSAATICDLYDGSVPFAVYLKQYFQQNKKSGSKDRRYLSQLCYAYFRTGHSIVAKDTEEKIKASLFLCEPLPGEWSLLFPEEWLARWKDDIAGRWKYISSVFPGSDAGNLFPWLDELSEGIDAVSFPDSHLIQPDLFLRIRPGKEKTVHGKLTDAAIAFQQLNDDCIALPNSTKIDTILEIDKEVVVQDYSSQRVSELLKLTTHHLPLTNRTVWDCCAASGGKSILAVDKLDNIDLTVSDVRASILRNLEKRFANAGIRNYHSFIADLTKELKIQNSEFKMIICDAPCSGSGTWGRTPEQLCFFTKDKISYYADLQKKIITNVLPALAKDGYFLYITCSVFKKENEEAVSFILQNTKLALVKMELLKGYDKKADSMFGALFRAK